MSEGQRPKFSIFHAREATDVTDEVMPLFDAIPERDQRGLGAMVEEGVLEGGQAKILYEDTASNLSLTHNWFKPHYPLPRHSHNADCLYYIISGEVRMGAEVLRAGDGFFVPADDLYTYEVGPEGVEMVEFRTAARYDVTFKTADAMWARLREKVKEHREGWKDAVPPLSVRRMAGLEA